jgi:hypothetical protein
LVLVFLSSGSFLAHGECQANQSLTVLRANCACNQTMIFLMCARTILGGLGVIRGDSSRPVEVVHIPLVSAVTHAGLKSSQDRWDTNWIPFSQKQTKWRPLHVAVTTGLLTDGSWKRVQFEGPGLSKTLETKMFSVLLMFLMSGLIAQDALQQMSPRPLKSSHAVELPVPAFGSYGDPQCDENLAMYHHLWTDKYGRTVILLR